MFKPYPKIHRLGKDEVDGVLNGTCIIQEKIDGANTSIWMEGDLLHTASRNQEVSTGFNGFVDYVKEHEGIQKLLKDHPGYHLYGEWLVKHSVDYNALAYKHFYLFDIMVGETFLNPKIVTDIADEYRIKFPKIFNTIDNPTEEDVRQYVGKSELGDVGEGIVIKNNDFINKFGDCIYAKLVTENFKETNAIVFGGNNKSSLSYWEIYIMNKYMTLERVRKIIQKIEPTLDGKIDLKDIPRVSSTAYHDLLTEEIWEIQKKAPTVNFSVLKGLCTKKAIQIFKDILNNNISVAYTHGTDNNVEGTTSFREVNVDEELHDGESISEESQQG